MVHHLSHDPLVPGMLPVLTRVLAVGDTARLALLVPNLHLRGYQAVTTSTDPAAAMAGLCLQGGQGFNFDVVIVDITSEYPGRGAALQLFEFAVREPQLCAYGLSEDGQPFGPLEMNDLNISRKSIYSVESNGPKSLQITLNGPYDASTSTTTSILTNSPSSGKRVTRNNGKHVCDSGNMEVDQDGEHVEKEQQQPTQKPKQVRIVWTDELHKKFVEAYDKLVTTGDAVPKKILALMENPTLTRENVASHLQKHRLNLQREKFTDHLRTSHSRRKQHRSTPHASFRSSNKSRQQAPPTIMQSRSATVHVNHLVVCMQTLNTMDKSNDSMLVDVPPKGMFPGDDDPEQNSASCVGNSDKNSPQEDDISVILNKDPMPSWDEKFLSNGN